MKINRQFAWVLFGILLIHVVAITAFQRSNDERRREHSRADLPSQEEMGTSKREALAGSTIEEKTDEQRAAAKQAYLDLTSVSEDVFVEFGTDAEGADDPSPVAEEPTLYSPDTAALPVPTPIADGAAMTVVPDTEISRLETVLGNETTVAEAVTTIKIPEPLDRDIEPAPTRNVAQNDTPPITQRKVAPAESPAPVQRGGIDRSRLKPVQLRPLTLARPVLASTTASQKPEPKPLPIAKPVEPKPTPAALKPIQLPAERPAVSPAPPILRAQPVKPAVQDTPPAVRPTGRPDMKSLPRVDRIRR